MNILHFLSNPILTLSPPTLTGGLTPKNIEHLQDPDGIFLKAFHNKGTASKTN